MTSSQEDEDHRFSEAIYVGYHPIPEAMSSTLEDKLAERRKNFKKAVDPDDARRKREDDDSDGYDEKPPAKDEAPAIILRAYPKRKAFINRP